MNFFIQRHSYGIAFIFSGLPTVWIIRALAGAPESQMFSIIFMIISICLVVYPPNLSKSIAEVLFPPLTDSYIKLAPLLFLIPVLIAAIWISRPNDFGPIYILFTIAFLIAINTVPYERLVFLPQAFLLIGGLGCFIVMIYTVANGVDLDGQRLGAGGTNSPGQVSFMGGTAMLTAFFMIGNASKIIGSKFKMYAYTSILVGTAVVILAVSRSTLISLFLCLVLGLFNNFYFQIIKKNKKTNFLSNNQANKKAPNNGLPIKMFVLAIIILIIIFYSDSILEFIAPVTKTFNIYQKRFLDYLQGGVASYFGGKSKEASATGRRELLAYALANMNDIGHGYKALWVDFPIIQAFYDLGLLGGIMFFVVTFIIPYALIINSIILQELDMIKSIVIYLYVFDSPGLFLHGQPYDFYIWLRIILLYAVMSKSFLFARNHHNFGELIK